MGRILFEFFDEVDEVVTAGPGIEISADRSTLSIIGALSSILTEKTSYTADVHSVQSLTATAAPKSLFSGSIVIARSEGAVLVVTTKELFRGSVEQSGRILATLATTTEFFGGSIARAGDVLQVWVTSSELFSGSTVRSTRDLIGTLS